MSRTCRSGLLISQLIECLGPTPLTDEQVWALCYELCKSLVDNSNKETMAGERDAALRCSSTAVRVVFQLDTVYLRREGSIAFVLHGNNPCLSGTASNDASATREGGEGEENARRQMQSFGQLLLACMSDVNCSGLETGNELVSMVNLMIQGGLKDTHGHWVHVVSDWCGQHASCQNTLPSKYYRNLCKELACEALNTSDFLDMLIKELSFSGHQDAAYTIQLYHARGTIKDWLKVMVELRETFSSINLRRPQKKLLPRLSEHQGSPESQSGSQPLLVPFETNSHNLTDSVDFGKPPYSSTPRITPPQCTPTKKVLRPPQRLVDEVTRWILESPPKPFKPTSPTSPDSTQWSHPDDTSISNLDYDDATSISQAKKSGLKDSSTAISLQDNLPQGKLPISFSSTNSLSSGGTQKEKVSLKKSSKGHLSPNVFDSRNLYPRKWTELDSQGRLEGDDSSWLSDSHPNKYSSGWFREISRIRGVLTAIQLDSYTEETALFQALHDGKICFCCRQAKFSVFGRIGVPCSVCARKVCHTCVYHARSSDLGIRSSDHHRGERTRPAEGVLKHIRQVFGRSMDEYDMEICRDCRDFVGRFL